MEFRTFCKTLDVSKKHTPYHPQCEGMAERNAGFVKQVILCFLLDKRMPKGSWPCLLPEVSFHCNSMINAASKVSPFILTYGRQPHSPIDLWCENMQPSELNSHGEYLGTLKKKQYELQEIARENI